jgi:hypothetical protein
MQIALQRVDEEKVGVTRVRRCISETKGYS